MKGKDVLFDTYNVFITLDSILPGKEIVMGMDGSFPATGSQIIPAVLWKQFSESSHQSVSSIIEKTDYAVGIAPNMEKAPCEGFIALILIKDSH